VIGRKSNRARKLQKREMRFLLLLCCIISLLFVATLAFFQDSSSLEWLSNMLTEEEQKTIWNDLSDESRKIIQKHSKP